MDKPTFRPLPLINVLPKSCTLILCSSYYIFILFHLLFNRELMYVHVFVIFCIYLSHLQPGAPNQQSLKPQLHVSTAWAGNYLSYNFKTTNDAFSYHFDMLVLFEQRIMFTDICKTQSVWLVRSNITIFCIL